MFCFVLFLLLATDVNKFQISMKYNVYHVVVIINLVLTLTNIIVYTGTEYNIRTYIVYKTLEYPA